MTNENQGVGLLPCPFCGGDKLAFCKSGRLQYVECRNCRATGTQTGTKADVIAAWNTRNKQPDTQTVDEEYAWDDLEERIDVQVLEAANGVKNYIDASNKIWEMVLPHLRPYLKQQDGEGWLPIESVRHNEADNMFVVIGIDVCNGSTGGRKYTTDPCCVWLEPNGSFARWGHNFPPTHWMPLPPTTRPPHKQGGVEHE